MLQRKWFFWLERLDITRQERIAVLSLLSLLFLLTVFNHYYEPAPPYSPSDYAALRVEFRAKSEALKREQEKLMARYRPGPEALRPSPIVVADTADSTQTNPAFAQADTSKKTGPAKLSPVDINKAPVSALESLPGIGPAIAGRIVRYRQTNGAFRTMQDLRKVKGIGKKRLEKILPFIKL